MNFIKRFLYCAFMLATLAVCLAPKAYAQDEAPIVTISTSAYATIGASNMCTILIGGTEEDYIDVDCGFGPVEYKLEVASFNTESATWEGTYLSCNVSSAGTIKIYGDPAKIDIINASGCYIRKIDFPQLLNLEILDLSHNELTALDLSDFSSLKALYLNDNPFGSSPLKIGGNKPSLMILDIGQIDHLDSSFNLSDYPAMATFDAWSCKDLTYLDPSGCPKIQKISIDSTPVQSLNVSNNPNLAILNISETGIEEIDLSNNPNLIQFYADHQSGSVNAGKKLKSLDIANNTYLQYLFASGNDFTSVDLSNNIYLTDVYLNNNLLTSINLDNNTYLQNLMLRNNYFDFATLPLPNEQWLNYDYMQRNMPLAKSQKVGTVIDLSSKVLRDGCVTTMAMYKVDEANPNGNVALGEEYYTYEDGKVTLLKETTDSVYLAFACDAFPLTDLASQPLRTVKFIVKSEENFGIDDKAFTFSTPISSNGASVSMSIGMVGASAESPKTFYVDFGAGKKEFTASTAGIPESPNVVDEYSMYGKITVYVPQDEQIGSLAIDGLTITAIDLSNLRSLRELRITDAELYSIDLGWNRSLAKLELTGNHFGTLNIRGANDAYQKTLLADINLSNNELTSVTLNDMYTIHKLNLSNNKLTELGLKDSDMLEQLNVAYNQLTDLNLSYCTLMTDLDISHNAISSITLPSELSFKRIHCENNAFTYSTLPVIEGLEEFTYSPQNDVKISSKGPGCDLSAHNFQNATVYEWHSAADDALLVNGTDYSEADGKTRFLEPVIGKKLYCVMTNAILPQLTLTTSQIEAAEMPTHVLASMKTTADCTGSVIMVAKEPETLICIDWKGDGVELEQYIIGTSPTTFNVSAHKDATARVYSYDELSGLTVFSINNIAIDSIDASNMTELTALTVRNAGLNKIKMPNANLSELNLDGNNLSEETLDLSAYSGLGYLMLNSNKFTQFDASKLPNLFNLGLNNNLLTSITLDNPDIWSLALSTNALTEIDLSGVPALYQIALDHNQLSELNIDGLSHLDILFIDYNRFRFSTLPLGTNLSLYTYANQAALPVELVEGKIDLSSEANIDGTATVYRWFVNAPFVDNEGALTGEELYVDDEYSVEGGVTSFHSMINNVVGALTNDKFPKLILLTEPVDITSTTGVETTMLNSDAVRVEGRNIVVTTSANAAVKVYNVAGMLVRSIEPADGVAVAVGMEPGIYVVSTAHSTHKVIVR